MRLPIALMTFALGLIGTGCGPGNSQGLLRDAVDAKRESLEFCYEAALRRDESVSGTVRARLHVERANGSVHNMEVLDSEVTDEALTSCMASALTGIRLADTPSVDLAVDYEFELVPNPAEQAAEGTEL